MRAIGGTPIDGQLHRGSLCSGLAHDCPVLAVDLPGVRRADRSPTSDGRAERGTSAWPQSIAGANERPIGAPRILFSGAGVRITTPRPWDRHGYLDHKKRFWDREWVGI